MVAGAHAAAGPHVAALLEECDEADDLRDNRGHGLIVLGSRPAPAAGVDAALQAEIDVRAAGVKAWASDPAVVAAVKASQCERAGPITQP